MARHDDKAFQAALGSQLGPLKQHHLRKQLGTPDQFMPKLPLFRDKTNYMRAGPSGIHQIDRQGLERHFLNEGLGQEPVDADQLHEQTKMFKRP